MFTSMSDQDVLRETGIEMVQQRQYAIAADLLTRYLVLRPDDTTAAVWLAYTLPVAEGLAYSLELVARFPLDPQVAACFATFNRWHAVATRPAQAQNAA